MLFPAGVNPDGINPGFPLGVDSVVVLILITCLTFIPYAPTVTFSFLPPPSVALTFIPTPIAAITFTNPAATLTWLSVLSNLNFTDRPTVEVAFHDNHATCP